MSCWYASKVVVRDTHKSSANALDDGSRVPELDELLKIPRRTAA